MMWVVKEDIRWQCDVSIIEIEIVCIVQLSLTYYSVEETDDG